MASPLLIEIALHYYCRTDDYREGDFSAPAVREAIDWFRDEGFLIAQDGGNRAYEPSDGLRMFVEALKAVPWPIRNWAMPS